MLINGKAGCRQSCLPRRQCIARGESTDHLPLCRYSNITGSFYHYVHRKKKIGRKVKVSKREEMENKISLLRALQQTDENTYIDSILIKGTQINGFSLKAALCAFDPKLKLYKSSFALPIPQSKKVASNIKSSFNQKSTEG